MGLVGRATRVVCKVVVVIAINLVLFLLLPAVHGLMGRIQPDPRGHDRKLRILAEIITPPKQEEKQEVKRRIRTVQTGVPRMGSLSGMDMRFVPDLGVEMGEGVGIAGRDLQAEVFEEGQADQPAVALYQPPLNYPDRARELGIQGVFRARYVIGLDGKVESLEVIRSAHPSFTTAARAAVDKWRFRPARNRGVPVRERRILEVNFELD